MFVSLLEKYIIGCPSDNIPDIECSLASEANVMSFFGSKIFTTDFFATITFNLSKAFHCFSDQINSTFFFLKFANSSVKSVYFGTYCLQKFTNPQKYLCSFFICGCSYFLVFFLSRLGLVIYLLLKWYNLKMTFCFYYSCIFFIYCHSSLS